jgi:hypothetical protein
MARPIEGIHIPTSWPHRSFRAGFREHSTHPISLSLYDGSGYQVGFLTPADAEQLGAILTSLAILHKD